MSVSCNPQIKGLLSWRFKFIVMLEKLRIVVGWKGGTKLTSFLNLMIFLRNCIDPCAIINFQTQEFSFTIDMALGYKLSTHISYHRFQI